MGMHLTPLQLSKTLFFQRLMQKWQPSLKKNRKLLQIKELG